MEEKPCSWILYEQILRKITGHLTYSTGNFVVKMVVQLGFVFSDLVWSLLDVSVFTLYEESCLFQSCTTFSSSVIQPQCSQALGKKKVFLLSVSPHLIFCGQTEFKNKWVMMNCLIFSRADRFLRFLSLPPLPAFQKRNPTVNIPAGLAERQRGNHMLPLSDFPPPLWFLRAVRERLLLQRRELNASDFSGKLQQAPTFLFLKLLWLLPTK